MWRLAAVTQAPLCLVVWMDDCRFFKRSVPGNYQTVLSNGFGALASWGFVLAPGLSITDDIGVFLAQDVS
jgi:hypothetical protein